MRSHHYCFIKTYKVLIRRVGLYSLSNGTIEWVFTWSGKAKQLHGWLVQSRKGLMVKGAEKGPTARPGISKGKTELMARPAGGG